MDILQVKQFMTGKILSFSEDMSLETAVDKLLKSDLIGGPVVNEEGLVIGWLSEQDCLAKMIEGNYYSEHAALVGDVKLFHVRMLKKDGLPVVSAVSRFVDRGKSAVLFGIAAGIPGGDIADVADFLG